MAMAPPELATAATRDAESLAATPAPAAGYRQAWRWPRRCPRACASSAGDRLPPDVLRNRLSQEQQAAIAAFVAQVETSAIAVQATFVAAMLASEPAKWRTQLTRLAPLLGIELFKATQAQIARLAQLAPASRLPLLVDLLTLLDGVEPADRKRLRAVARAFAPTVATGDMLRFSLTRMHRGAARARRESNPYPCRCRNVRLRCANSMRRSRSAVSARASRGRTPIAPASWGCSCRRSGRRIRKQLIAPAALDIALAGVAQIHPTGKRSLSEGMARVIAVGGRMTVPQVDLLRGACLIVDCPVPLIPIDVVFEEADVMTPKSQASAR